MRITRAQIAAIAVLVTLAACGSQPPSPDASTAPPTIPPGDAAALRYTCGQFPFAADMLQRPGNAELGDDPIGVALRAHLARPDVEIDILPDRGWTLVGREPARAELVASDAGGQMLSISLAAEGGEWTVTGWGQCQPMRVLPQGLGDATWHLAPGQSIGPETTTFEAMVTERACASGRSSEGRIVGPDVLALADAVLVTFAVRPLAGAQDCQGNPATSVSVTLPEPLGERRLLDGSTLPPREPRPDP